MTNEKEYKTTPLRSALIISVITLFVLTSLTTSQFLYKYRNDLFHKNLDQGTIIKMGALVMITSSSIIIPITLLIFAAVFYRRTFRIQEKSVRNTVKKAILPVLVAGIGIFFWSAFVIPGIKLHQFALLYDIRMKEPNEALKRTDIQLFSDAPIASNFIQLGCMIDSSEANINNIKKQVVYYILTLADSVEINQLLSDTISKELGFTQADFVNDEMKNDGHLADTAHKLTAYLHNYLVAGQISIKREQEDILGNRILQSEMVALPFTSIICFYMGLFIGILNRHQKYLWLLLCGILFVLFPAIYYLEVWFDRLINDKKVSPALGQLYFLSLLLIICFLLHQYSLRHRRSETSLDL